MNEVMVALIIAISATHSLAGDKEYPAELECKTGLCKDGIYRRAVRIYCENEEQKQPALKAQNWGPYLLKVGGGCWCSCAQFR